MSKGLGMKNKCDREWRQKMIILENSIVRMKILPELGGKILSFYRKDKEFELAAQKSRGDGLTLSGAGKKSPVSGPGMD